MTRRCTSGSSVRPSLWNTELMCFSMARSVRNSALGDRGVVLSLRHVGQDLALALGERRERRMGHALLRGDERLRRPSDRAPSRRATPRRALGRAPRRRRPAPSRDTRAPRRRPSAARTRSPPRRTARAPRRRSPDGPRGCAGRLDPLGGVRRRHPDVGEHRVGRVLVDGPEQRGEILDGGDELDVARLGEQVPPSPRGRDSCPRRTRRGACADGTRSPTRRERPRRDDPGRPGRGQRAGPRGRPGAAGLLRRHRGGRRGRRRADAPGRRRRRTSPTWSSPTSRCRRSSSSRGSRRPRDPRAPSRHRRGRPVRPRRRGVRARPARRAASPASRIC